MTNLIKYLKSEKIKKNLFLSPLTTFLEHTWIHPMIFAGSVLLIFFDFLNFPFFIAPSIFFNFYFKSHFVSKYCIIIFSEIKRCFVFQHIAQVFQIL